VRFGINEVRDGDDVVGKGRGIACDQCTVIRSSLALPTGDSSSKSRNEPTAVLCVCFLYLRLVATFPTPLRWSPIAHWP
jgi:hypothetical protein